MHWYADASMQVMDQAVDHDAMIPSKQILMAECHDDMHAPRSLGGV